jgi:hypothetical protein
LVEVDEADFATAGTRQQFGEAFVCQEDAVAGELLED